MNFLAYSTGCLFLLIGGLPAGIGISQAQTEVDHVSSQDKKLSHSQSEEFLSQQSTNLRFFPVSGIDGKPQAVDSEHEKIASRSLPEESSLAVEESPVAELKDIPTIPFITTGPAVFPGLSRLVSYGWYGFDTSYLEERLISFQEESPSSSAVRRYESLFSNNEDSAENGSSETSLYGEVPIILTPEVEQSIRYFQTVIPDRFQEWLTRFYHYKPVVEQIFGEFGLPKELIYLSIVESGFNPRAYSRARAAGPWQFMKGTGRIYGLRVNWYLDERRDPIKSTVAAAQHLRDLYDRFGSWPLALAAYNAGAGKITRAIQKTKSTDYWHIRKTRYIRRETKHYVPRFMAATIIASNPTLFGFSSGTEDSHEFAEVLMKDRVHLRSVAKEAGIPFEELRRLNPELRRSITPPEKEGYYLKVPVGMHQQVMNVQDQIQLWTQPIPVGQDWYRVRRGDSLSVIANRFGMSVQRLKDLNNLSSHMIRIGDRLRVSEDHVPSGNGQWYRVRQGDSLSEIAKRFGVTVQQLKQLNNLSGNLIRAGDRLQVSGQSVQAGDVKWYRVRQGDSLWSIAQQFRVTITDLKMLNNLTSSVIHAGLMLMVTP